MTQRTAALVLLLALTISTRALAQAEIGSLNYRLRGSLAAASGDSASDSTGLRATGSTLGIGALGTSIGEETGLILAGGLWPVLVGAAFDQDRDLVPNVTDNCTVVRNTLQLDVGGDGYGNACDADITNDGIVNFADLAQLKRSFYTNDAIADLNADGVVNFADLAIMKKAFFKKPGPAAGKP
jgi:hypothetical protein